MSTITTIDTPPTPTELWRAYRRSGLLKQGTTFLKALQTPSIYQTLVMNVDATRKKQQQHGKPAPTLQAA